MKRRSISCFLCAAWIALGVTGVPAARSASPTNHAHLRVYSHLLDPRQHPDYERRAVKPPSWDAFKNRTQFTCLRGFNVENDRVVGYAEEIEKFTRKFDLGEVIWPSYPILFAKNLGDLAEEMKRRDLYLFDVWGYVPGSGPGGYWQQFQPPAEAFTTLEARLGERWLGTDIGEQDGRYIGGYANQMTPASASRFEQYLNFQRHFERMGDDLGHRHATLVSLNFGHYFLKEGTYTLIGAETAQALPNSQVYYAFIRGAGKQYGVPWFGNASIFNRWGYKVYGSSGRSDGYDFGPTKGTSLSLLKRLLYSHILYNSVAVGFENGWFEGDKLSPIGRIQQAAQRWVKQNGQPGVMHTPVALLLDFYSGWTFPRHLYTDKVYRVWGNLPYEPGDYLTDGVLDQLYPGYADASYFHDETGFIAATPYGDLADCLLSDAPLWVLKQYPVVIVAGELHGGREVQQKLLRYAAEGGHLVFSGGCWPAGVEDASHESPTVFKDSPQFVQVGNRKLAESGLALYRLPVTRPFKVLARHGAAPVVIQRSHGQGRITTLASPHGIPVQPAGAATNRTDTPLTRPYPLLNHVRSVLAEILQEQGLFVVDPRLALITCRKGPGEYTLGLFNNTWHELPLKIASLCGSLASVRELPLDQSEKGAPGYAPEGVDVSKLGTSGEGTIAGGDVRIFAVKVKEAGVQDMPQAQPPPRPQGRILPLRRATSIKEEILARPTFFEHFDGVCVDWRYLHEREKPALQAEARWLQRQGARVMVDLSSGVDLYPTLRLIDNLPADYEASLAAVADVLAKMEALGAHDLILSLHRHPENNFTGEQTQAAFEKTLKALAPQAASHKVTLHLRLAFGKPPWSLDEAMKLVERVGASNLKLAPSTALLSGAPPGGEAAERLKRHVGLWLVAGRRTDVAGQLWDAHAPLHASLGQVEAMARWWALAPDVPRVLDAVLANPDDEYLEALQVK